MHNRARARLEAPVRPASPTGGPRVLLVDDHVIFRRGLRALLEEHGIDVVAEAPDGGTALGVARRVTPDVVVVDLNMPVLSGVDTIARLAHDMPAVRVLVITVSSSGDDIIDAILAGACGYLLKDDATDTIIEGVRAAAAGQSLISPRMAARLLERLRRHVTRPDHRTTHLTPREIEVLQLVTKGMDNTAIGSALSISPSTVRNHVSNILEKLEVENRIQAAVIAVQSGLV
jgi:two-component system, NarL family, nitrate/nitrite response regulator NarL